MSRINNLPLGQKLVLLFLGLSLIPLAGVTWMTRTAAVDGAEQISASSTEAIRGQTLAQLETVREGRAKAVTRLFDVVRGQITTFSSNLMVSEAARAFTKGAQGYSKELGLDGAKVEQMRSELATYYTGEFGRVYRESNERAPRATIDGIDAAAVALQHSYIFENQQPLGSKHMLDLAGDGTSYDAAHERYHSVLRQYLEEFGYYDIFIVDPRSGRVVYSVYKELDYATSLKTGPYAQSGLAQAFRAVAESSDPNEVHLTDFANYYPSYEAPASFISSPIRERGELVGVAIFQMPLEKITSAASGREGLGETGEAFLVGGDFLPRSDSYRSPAHGVVAAFRNPAAGRVDHESVSRALAGEKGTLLASSYDGTEVLSAYGPIDILGMRWAVIAEQATSEALAAIAEIDAISDATTSSMMTRSYAMLGAACLVVLVVSLLVSRGISGRLGRIGGTLASRAASAKTTANILRDTSRSLSASADTEAASLEDVSARFEEMDSLTSMNAANTDRARKLARQSSDESQEGNQSMQNLSLAMDEIAASSAEMLKIVRSIEGIAFQTNLLALNAAVEAARAGEHGKGFAVVAEEVRGLAQRAAEAARQTGALIEESSERVERGTQSTREASASLGRIATTCSETVELIGEIATASSEISQGIQQINEAVTAMDDTTQKNASSAKESAQGSEELHGQAEQLDEIVEELLRLVGQQRQLLAEGTGAVRPRSAQASAPLASATAFSDEF
jgi:methyl-accepting chemotaxis protein